jgi:hypothetical protein
LIIAYFKPGTNAINDNKVPIGTLGPYKLFCGRTKRKESEQKSKKKQIMLQTGIEPAISSLRVMRLTAWPLERLMFA